MTRGRTSTHVAVTVALLGGLLATNPRWLIRAGAQYHALIDPGLTVPALRYQLLDTFGTIRFCDSDAYPVAVGGAEQARAIQAFPEIRTAPALYQAIMRHLRLDSGTDLSDAQKLLVYREYKKLRAIDLAPLDGKYRFRLVVSRTDDPAYGGKLTALIEGVIDDRGAITVSAREPHQLQCPICLAGTTRIDTPRGPTLVRDLRAGMPVWTADSTGNRRRAPILLIATAPAAVHHEMVDLVLDDGREFLASPGHPTTDGRVIGALAVGDRLDGRRVTSTTRVPYTEAFTYDILPAGDTGAYWANGVPLASTLFDAVRDGGRRAPESRVQAGPGQCALPHRPGFGYTWSRSLWTLSAQRTASSVLSGCSGSSWPTCVSSPRSGTT
jgi:hypothetical protein